MKTNEFSIPTLYRGDSDPKRIRGLKDLLPQGQFKTNYLQGGVYDEVYNRAITDVLDRHTDPKEWPQTPFLSFSSNKLTAFRFGSGNLLLTEEEAEAYFEGDGQSGFYLFTMRPESCKWSRLENGVYEGQFPSSIRKFQMSSASYSIMLFDTVTIFQHTSTGMALSEGAKNAMAFKEWLIFPATPVVLDQGRVEYSAIMDAGCFDICQMTVEFPSQSSFID